MVFSESMQFNQSTADNLNPADTVVPLLKKTDEQIKQREKSSIITQTLIYDSFILGHDVNGLLGMGTILDGFNGDGINWLFSGNLTNNITPRIEYDGNAFNFGSIKLALTGIGNFSIQSWSYDWDLSSYTGVSSGTPTRGTVGLWLYLPSDNCISGVQLTIGGDEVYNFISVLGKEYRIAYSSGYRSYTTSEWNNLSSNCYAGWNYFLFPLTHLVQQMGTPNWVHTTYTGIFYNADITNLTIYADYLTISSSDYIGLNGLGSRTVIKDYFVVNPNNVFRETFRFNQFDDTTNSNSTMDTTNFRWEFTNGDSNRTLSIFKNKQAVSQVNVNLTLEGVKVTTMIDTVNYPWGFQKDIT